MKRNKLLVGLVTLGVTTILFTRCAEVPQTEIDLATAAIEEAKSAGAEIYATDGFVALQDSMKAAVEGIEAEKSKLISNYTASKESLAKVSSLAAEVKQQAETRKEALKSEIQQAVADIKTLLEANKLLILEAPKGKEGTTALIAIQEELNTIETAVTETNLIFDQGDYLTSLNKASAAKEKVTALNTELQDVITKYKTNVKGKRG